MQVPTIEQVAIHFAMDSNLLHKESDEVQRQMHKQEEDASSVGDNEEEGEETSNEQTAEKKKGSSEKQLRNQFNFSERASQTLNNPFRVGHN